jgi:hypothetical protein
VSEKTTTKEQHQQAWQTVQQYSDKQGKYT